MKCKNQQIVMFLLLNKLVKFSSGSIDFYTTPTISPLCKTMSVFYFFRLFSGKICFTSSCLILLAFDFLPVFLEG